jgi:hypothetical protein
MNKRMNDIARAYLTARYGAYCARCKVSELQKLLVVDHKDNDNDNNDPNNWQFLCYRCNYLKNPRLAERTEPLDSVWGGVSEVISTYRENEISINREKEPLFRKYVEYTVKELGQVSQQDLINGGAEYCSCSIKTTTKYLAKLTSPVGKYDKFKKDKRIMVCLKDAEGLI